MASFKYSSVVPRIEPEHVMIHTIQKVAQLECRCNYTDLRSGYWGTICVLGEMVNDFI